MKNINFWQKIEKPILALAPMAGFSDSAFRQICVSYGADVVYSEMASVTALYFNQGQENATLELLKQNKRLEKYYVVQLFGSIPEHFAVATKIITKEIKPDGIDINFGCPVSKVIKQGAGSDLMKNLVKARAVVKAVCDNTGLPVSIKIRAKSGEVDALEFLQALKGLPIAALMIHGRTVTEGFAGEINYKLIKDARSIFNGIILANGGINNLFQAKQTLALTEADGLGLARGILGRPWLFREIKKNQKQELLPNEIFKIALNHAKLTEKLKGKAGIIELRKHLCWYVQGITGASVYRSKLVKVETYKEIEDIFKNTEII